MKILFSVNSSWNIINFRSGLIRSLVKNNHKVLCVVPYDSFTSKIFELGSDVYLIKLMPRSKNIFYDFLLLIQYTYIFLRFNPDLYLGFTIKPNFYGSILASLFNIPTINNIAGLGQIFSTSNFTTKIVCFIYKLILANSCQVFFQNIVDKNYFEDSNLVNKNKSFLLPGSGVNIDTFCLVALPSHRKLRFTMISRLLWDKGINEFNEASFIINNKGYDVEFYLFGFTDNSSGSVQTHELNKIILNKNIIYGGRTNDSYKEIENSHCIVLPSFYNEGTPRILLEGAAMGRPLITTDTKGCRDVVTHGENGFLCKTRDSVDLSNQIEKIILMSDSDRNEFGLKGRHKVSCKYDEKFVLHKYQQAINKIQFSSNYKTF